MDRRSLVFLGFSALSFALYPLADKYDNSDTWEWGKNGWSWVAVALGVVYIVLALASWLDHWSSARIGPRPLGYDREDGPES